MDRIIYDSGINILTGEACAFNMRVLCDLTEEGCKIIEEFFGGTITCTRETNWNSGGVASVMIPRSCLKDLEKFCLLRSEGMDDRNVHQMSGRRT